MKGVYNYSPEQTFALIDALVSGKPLGFNIEGDRFTCVPRIVTISGMQSLVALENNIGRVYLYTAEGAATLMLAAMRSNEMFEFLKEIPGFHDKKTKVKEVSSGEETG